ncbi:pseudouridine synthase deg1 [Coemansia nantahalensis]|uniref:Pseudouridine synthase deg1 n=1 Tax=Coemansia nantahalensis TaxID=2789366 RepID=A0ACC1K6K4_9FUNG|nr:pseudouridine synthase deg1 [Coemansia nantahalensis]
MDSAGGRADYAGWSRDELIARLHALESQAGGSAGDRVVREAPAAVPEEACETPRKRKKRVDQFDFSRFSQRKVALKFSYFGWPYHGLARQGNALESDSKQEVETQYPTVEGELFRALAQCKLIVSESECDYSRCGRTDRGVSGFGQVASLYVRSTGKFLSEGEAAEIAASGTAEHGRVVRDEINGARPVLLPLDELELPYVTMLNKHLPPEIRILAWSPVAADFSARFSCRSRFYRYFFSEEGLDIGAMRDGARRFLGAHDFRNFCRLDPAKQIQNFERVVLSVEINPVAPVVPLVGVSASPMGRWWQLELRGTAFLWHQVRCMMAILFAVGQGLEAPDIVDRMLDVETMNGKPEYEMACDTPLVLADSAYDEADVQWRYVRCPGREASNMVHLDREIGQVWGRLNTQAVLASALLQVLRDTRIPVPAEAGSAAAAAGGPPTGLWANCHARLTEAEQRKTTRAILGGGHTRCAGKYVPIAQRRRADPVHQRNEAWLKRKGSSKRAKSDHP